MGGEACGEKGRKKGMGRPTGGAVPWGVGPIVGGGM